MTACHLPLYVALALLAMTKLTLAEVFWNQLNCPDGTVTDGLCCVDTVCTDYTQRGQCNKQATCLWNATSSSCHPNRDPQNNVCCLSEVKETCHSLFNGECPSHFQVTPNCCSPENVLDSNVFKVNVSRVCCNTPCSDATKNNCESPADCVSGVAGRSYGSYGPPRQVQFGFNPYYLPKLPTYGQVLPYTGLEAYHHQLPGKEHASVGEVQEITVNDLLNAMVEALSNDKDVFSYSSEIYSDPYFGKSKHGGPLGGINLPDPNIFLRQEYGNPYGLSSGQFGFEGKGWPGVQGVYPGSGYGYLQSQRGYNYGPYQQSYGNSYGYQNNFGNAYSSPNGYPSPYGNFNGNQYGNSYGNHYGNTYGYAGQGYGNGSPSYGNDYNSQSYDGPSQSYAQ